MLKKIIIGFSAGIITGLFGAGGGMILVPAFAYIFKMEEREARATSIFCILQLVCVSGFFYFKASYIDWKISSLCAIGGIIGAIIGSKLLRKLSIKTLRLSFTAFLAYIAIRMILQGMGT